MPGQTRSTPGARHNSEPSWPLNATTSYEPATTSGTPSPSMSTTAGELYQPVWHDDAEQPPYAHFNTGVCTVACAGNDAAQHNETRSPTRFMTGEVSRDCRRAG